MKNNKLYGTYFYGNEASDYAKENGRLDYATLTKAFDAVLNNNIMQTTAEIGYWETENGSEEYYEDNNGNTYTYDEKEERAVRVHRYDSCNAYGQSNVGCGADRNP